MGTFRNVPNETTAVLHCWKDTANINAKNDCEVDGLTEEQSVRYSSSLFCFVLFCFCFNQLISSRQRMQEGTQRTACLVKGGESQCRNGASLVSWLPALDEHHGANRRDGWRLELALSPHLLLCIA